MIPHLINTPFNIPIAVFEGGDRSSDVSILFIHGNSSSSQAFNRQFNTLGGFRLMAVDLPGHGASGDFPIQSMYSLPGYAEVVSWAIQQARLSKVFVVGWSLGGHIAIELLSREPRLIGGIVVGTPPFRSVNDFPSAFEPLDVLNLIQKGIVTEGDAHRWAMNCTLAGENYPAFLKHDFQRTDPAARLGLIESLSLGQFKDEWAELFTAGRPIALALGAEDPFIKRAFFDRDLLSGAWGQRLHMIPRAGHVAHWDAVEEFNSLLLRRIAELQ